MGDEKFRRRILLILGGGLLLAVVWFWREVSRNRIEEAIQDWEEIEYRLTMDAFRKSSAEFDKSMDKTSKIIQKRMEELKAKEGKR